MLQRIQTVWMGLAFLCTLALFYTKDDLGAGWMNSVFYFFAGAAGAIGLLNIFNYKKRKIQIQLNNVLIFINALLIGLLVYWLLTLSGGIQFPEKGIEPLFPLLAIICLLIANRYIGRDERLVKSVDRLR